LSTGRLLARIQMKVALLWKLASDVMRNHRIVEPIRRFRTDGETTQATTDDSNLTRYWKSALDVV